MANDSFILDIFNKGNIIVSGFQDNVGYISTNGSDSPMKAHIFSTVPGESYVIRLYTDNSYVYWSGYYVIIAVVLSNI